jgi:hypothetical protein
VLAELFKQYPSAVVVTAMATYTADTFHGRAINTAAKNIGSMYQPVYPTQLCECKHFTDRGTEAVMRGEEYGGKYASDGAYADDLIGRIDALIT